VLDLALPSEYRRDLMWFTISKSKPDHEAQCSLIGPAFYSARGARGGQRQVQSDVQRGEPLPQYIPATGPPIKTGSAQNSAAMLQSTRPRSIPGQPEIICRYDDRNHDPSEARRTRHCVVNGRCC